MNPFAAVRKAVAGEADWDKHVQAVREAEQSPQPAPPSSRGTQESPSAPLVYRPYNVTRQLKPKENGSNGEKAAKTRYTCQKILSKRNERSVLAV